MLDFDELEEIETQLRIAPHVSCDEASTFGILNCAGRKQDWTTWKRLAKSWTDELISKQKYVWVYASRTFASHFV